MTALPAGKCFVGCVSGVDCRLEEMPAHEVRIARPFALSIREITHAEYFRFTRPDKQLDPSWADRPAVHLAWEEARGYVEWLSTQTGETYRLPSEAEWECAARAGTDTAYSWGDRAEAKQALCWGCRSLHSPVWVANTGTYVANSLWNTSLTADVLATLRRKGRPTPIARGAYAANPWGLHDMHGNAAEWTADCWHEDHLGAPPDAIARLAGDCSRRVVRGGSYATPPRAIRSAARVGRQADERYLDVGFRVLRELRNVDAWHGG